MQRERANFAERAESRPASTRGDLERAALVASRRIAAVMNSINNINMNNNNNSINNNNNNANNENEYDDDNGDEVFFLKSGATTNACLDGNNGLQAVRETLAREKRSLQFLETVLARSVDKASSTTIANVVTTTTNSPSSTFPSLKSLSISSSNMHIVDMELALGEIDVPVDNGTPISMPRELLGHSKQLSCAICRSLYFDAFSDYALLCPACAQTNRFYRTLQCKANGCETTFFKIYIAILMYLLSDLLCLACN